MRKFYNKQRGLLKTIRLLALYVSFWLGVSATPLMGQCPGTVNITGVDVTAASCPSNGSILINAGGGANILYQIISGPQGFPTGAQNSNLFSDLLPGEYTVKASCQADPSVSATATITIDDNYQDVTASSAVSGVCSSSVAGGTITTTAASGNPPYQYAYFQGDPGLSDNDPVVVYGSVNSMTTSSYGVYNVRVKDACGVFVTHQISIEKNYPSDLQISQAFPKYLDLTCAQVASEVYLRFYFANGVSLSGLPASGIDLEVYYNNGDCNAPSEGAFIKTEHFNSYSPNDILVPNGQNLIIKVKTPCGDVTTYCYEHDTELAQMDVAAIIEAIDCPATPGDPINYGVSANVSELSVPPIIYELKNSSGVVVGTYTATDRSNTSAYFSGVPAGTYTVTATDDCGRTDFTTVTSPSGEPGVLTAVANTYIGCATINGRTTMDLRITGVMANLAQATAKIVAPSTSGIGTLGRNGGGGNYMWTDVIPGGTYTIEVDNQCGQVSTVTVTLPPGEARNQSISASVRQLCGGTGDITIDLQLEGDGYVSFDLLDQNGAVVGSGSAPGGVFTNLPAGTYSAIAHVTGCGPYDFSTTNIRILPGGSLPEITKKLGIVCEAEDGGPASTGKAILSFIGAQPLKVDYRLTSQTDADYINLTNDSDGSETIDGLTPGTSYIVRVTDACGNSTPVQISLGILDAMTTETSDKPCSGNPYTLSVPDMIDATYLWTKDGVFISSQRSIYFPSYATSDDGAYQCMIVIGGCVTRYVHVTLTDCKLPVTLQSFSATTFEKANVLRWVTTDEAGSSHFEVQRSLDARTWTAIGTVAAKGESRQRLEYRFEDRAPFAVLNYYRLKMVDADYSYTFSRIVHTGSQSNGELIVFPNPVSDVLFFSEPVSNNLRQVQLISSQGIIVKTLSASSISNGLVIRDVPAGQFTLVLTLNDGSAIHQKVVIAP